MDSTGGVLLDLARGKFYGLTFTAAEIARSLVGGASLEALLDLLGAKFEVPREELQQDLARFVEEMERAGLCSPGRGHQDQVHV
jgi:hypothetical protein